MKKNILFFIFALSIFVTPALVFAGETYKDRYFNVCNASGNKYDCAFCEYQYSNGYKLFRLALIYKGNEKSVSNLYYIETVNASGRYDMALSIDGSIVKEDFFVNGILRCPNISYSSSSTNQNNSILLTYTISKNGENVLQPLSSSTTYQKNYPIDDNNKENNNNKDNNSNDKENSDNKNNNTNMNNNVSDGIDYSSICSEKEVRDAMRIIGYVVQAIRWIVPLLLIVFGMVEFGKAAIASDEKALSNATASLIRRFVAGIIVFFVPTIIMAILNAIEITKGIEDKDNTEFGACTKCLFDPSEKSCPE